MRRILVGLLLLLSACQAGAPEAAPPEVPVTERLGMSSEEAETIWASLSQEPYSALVHKAECLPENELCQLQIRPAAWNQLPVDDKRNIATGIGRAGVISQGVEFINFIDMYSGADLATFSGPRTSVRLE